MKSLKQENIEIEEQNETENKQMSFPMFSFGLISCLQLE